MNFYEGFQNLAYTMLRKYGKDITINREIGSTFDPVTKENTPGVPEVENAMGVVVNYMNSEIDGTKIRRGDRLCILEARSLDNEPTTADRIVANGTPYTIEDVSKVEPTDVPVIYYLQVRK